MGFWEKLWNDIRPNLLWLILTSIFGGGLMAGLISGIRAWADNPVTITGAVIIFLVSLVAAAIGITIYLVRERRKKIRGGQVAAVQEFAHHNWIMAALGIIALLLIGWNVLLQQRVQHLEAKMIRYVLPRQLTEVQIEEFGKYLKSTSQPHEVRIRYIMGDSEAQRYAEDFASAFKAGNWLPNMMAVNPMAITCQASPPGATSPFSCSSELQQMINHLEGVTINQSGPNPPPPSTLEEKLHPPPYLSQIVSEALVAAGIQGISSGYGYSKDPLNTITVFVGFRPRDKFGVLPQSD